MRAPSAHHGGDGWEKFTGSVHVNFDAHPRMDAALEQVAALRQTSHFEPAALQNPGLGHRDGGKPTSAFGDDRFAGAVQRGDEPSPKLLHLRKGVGLTTLIDDRNKLPLIERRGNLVTREEILERVWGKGVFVDTENAINTAVRSPS